MSVDQAAAEFLGLLGSTAAWRDTAACTAADPERFAPTGQIGPDNEPELRDTARRYCAGCPVLAECRGFADETSAQGVWGGEYRHNASGKRPDRAGLLGAARFPKTTRKKAS